MSDDTLAADAGQERPRIDRLVTRYREVFGTPPAFVVRAPGRVNLLGEHTDYNGFPVLPMAIDRSVLIAGSPRRDGTVTAANLVARFSTRAYTLGTTIPPYAQGDWGNYSKAAAQGLARYCGKRVQQGADLLVDGNIPLAAGLSSSAALVVANALALLAANRTEVPFEDLAVVLAQAEQYVGTLSGGMDQATSLLARAGCALRIDFFPLRVRTVPLPSGYSIVVCHSLVPAEKSGAARQCYNLRVVECRLACRVVEHALGIALREPLQTLGDLAKQFPGRPLPDFVDALGLPDRPLSLAAIAAAAGATAEELRHSCGIGPEVGDSFALVRRTRHVLTEAERVDAAERCLRSGDAVGFGRLMAQSQQSCRDDYAISSSDLDTLVATAIDAGAVGARLTGAGFGGCTVNLVADDLVGSFLDSLDRVFYTPRLGCGVSAGDCRFVFSPQQGAWMLRV